MVPASGSTDGTTPNVVTRGQSPGYAPANNYGPTDQPRYGMPVSGGAAAPTYTAPPPAYNNSAPYTAYQAGVNSALRHYFKAVAATNSTDTDKVMAWMRANPVNDFFAQGGKVREDGRMVHDMYLMRIKKPEESKQKWDLYETVTTVPGDEAFRPLADGGCPFVK